MPRAALRGRPAESGSSGRPGRLYAQVGRPVLVQPEMKSNASQARRPATSHILLRRAEVAVMAQPPLTSTERLAWLDHQLTFFWAIVMSARIARDTSRSRSGRKWLPVPLER